MAPGGRHGHHLIIEEPEDFYRICFAQTRAPSSTSCLTRKLGLLDLTKTDYLLHWSNLGFSENNVFFPQEAWLVTEESKVLEWNMLAADNQQANFRTDLASAPSIAAKTLEEMATTRCDQAGILSLDFGICTTSREKISASGIVNILGRSKWKKFVVFGLFVTINPETFH